MTADASLLRRYEYKYLVAPERVPELRRAIEPWCAPDGHDPAGSGYTVVSLYFDSPDLACYRAKKDRHLDRYKLRVRTYGDAADGPRFLEVKRKVGDVVLKQRVRVTAPLGDVLADSQEGALDGFLYRMLRIGARPEVLIRYRRQAWVSTTDLYARVTFDEHISAQAADGVALCGVPGAWRGVDHSLVTQLERSATVVELKFQGTVPLWMNRLVRRHELMRVGFSKYCAGVDAVRGVLSAPAPRVAATGRTAATAPMARPSMRGGDVRRG